MEVHEAPPPSTTRVVGVEPRGAVQAGRETSVLQNRGVIMPIIFRQNPPIPDRIPPVRPSFDFLGIDWDEELRDVSRLQRNQKKGDLRRSIYDPDRVGEQTVI
jgi:hypothetical protein